MQSKISPLLRLATRLVLLSIVLCTILGVVTTVPTKETQIDDTYLDPQKQVFNVGASENKDVPVAPPPSNVPIKLKASPVLFTDIVYVTKYSIGECELAKESIIIASKSLDTELASGLYTEAAEESMRAERIRLQNVLQDIDKDITKYNTWEQEHYYAAKTWQFLMQHGYSEVAACGIIGNMMVETSGGSLALKPEIYSPGGSFYGLCQWSLYYRPNVADMPFEEQLEYLHADMEREFKTFGFCYRKGFTVEDFNNMTDPAQAALAFAKIYERCADWSYIPRKTAAKVAYNYFVLGE